MYTERIFEVCPQNGRYRVRLNPSVDLSPLSYEYV